MGYCGGAVKNPTITDEIAESAKNLRKSPRSPASSAVNKPGKPDHYLTFIIYIIIRLFILARIELKPDLLRVQLDP